MTTREVWAWTLCLVLSLIVLFQWMPRLTPPSPSVTAGPLCPQEVPYDAPHRP